MWGLWLAAEPLQASGREDSVCRKKVSLPVSEQGHTLLQIQAEGGRPFWAAALTTAESSCQTDQGLFVQMVGGLRSCVAR